MPSSLKHSFSSSFSCKTLIQLSIIISFFKISLSQVTKAQKPLSLSSFMCVLLFGHLHQAVSTESIERGQWVVLILEHAVL